MANVSVAIRSGDVSELKRVIQQTDGILCDFDELLLDAVWHQHVHVVKELLNSRFGFSAKLNELRSDDGQASTDDEDDVSSNEGAWVEKFSLLHAAIDNNDYETMKLLISRGADVTIKDGKGNTGLMRLLSDSDDRLTAAKKKCFDLLIGEDDSFGCDTVTRDSGENALHLYTRNIRGGYEKDLKHIMACLAKRIGNVNRKDLRGNTPLLNLIKQKRFHEAMWMVKEFGGVLCGNCIKITENFSVCSMTRNIYQKGLSKDVLRFMLEELKLKFLHTDWYHVCRECNVELIKVVLDLKKYDLTDHRHGGGVGGVNAADFFRSQGYALIYLLGRGARCPQEFEGNQTLKSLANDSQSVHTSTVNSVLNGLVSEAKRNLDGCPSKNKPYKVDRTLNDWLATLGESRWDKMGKADGSNIYKKKSPSDIEQSVRKSLTRFNKSLLGCSSGIIKNGAKAIEVVYQALYLELERRETVGREIERRIKSEISRIESANAETMLAMESEMQIYEEFSDLVEEEFFSSSYDSAVDESNYNEESECIHDHILRDRAVQKDLTQKESSWNRADTENAVFAQNSSSSSSSSCAVHNLNTICSGSSEKICLEKCDTLALIEVDERTIRSKISKEVNAEFLNGQLKRALPIVDKVKDEVIVPIAQSLLQAQNEYGWNQCSCAPGSISIMLNTLMGRIPDPEEENVGSKSQSVQSPSQNYKSVKEALNGMEELLKSGKTFLIQEDGMRCLRKYMRVRGSAAAEEIYDLMVDGDFFVYAKNELRGLFFRAICQSYCVFIKEHWTRHGPLGESERYECRDASRIAEIFTNVFLADGAVGVLLTELIS